MVWTCCVKTCQKEIDSSNLGYRFPTVNSRHGVLMQENEKLRRESWLRNVRLKESDIKKHSTVCSRHFISGRPNARDKCHPDWTPTLHLQKSVAGYSDQQKKTILSRYLRTKEKEQRNAPPKKKYRKQSDNKTDNVIGPLPVEMNVDGGKEDLNEEETTNQVNVLLTKVKKEVIERGNTGIQFVEVVDLTLNPVADEQPCTTIEVDKLKEEMENLRLENHRLCKLNEQLAAKHVILSENLHDEKKKIEAQGKWQLLSEIKKDDKKCLFYTGLNTYKLFKGIFESLKSAFQAPNYPEDPRFAVTLEEQYLITLVKLRLNLSNTDLAYRFDISKQTVTNYVEKFINAMFIRLPEVLLVWPDREAVLKTMPLSFKRDHPNINGIIDDTEVTSEIPGDTLDKCSGYSNYKHRHTTKFCICATPQGSVSFISKAFTGRASDAFTLQDSGFFDFVTEGDEFLADRGFLNEEDFTRLGAKLHRPAYKGQRDQLTIAETERSRIIANERIHIERVIGNLKKKFTVLRGPVKIKNFCADANNVSFIKKIFTVSCCLMNAQPTIVPQY